MRALPPPRRRRCRRDAPRGIWVGRMGEGVRTSPPPPRVRPPPEARRPSQAAARAPSGGRCRHFMPPLQYQGGEGGKVLALGDPRRTSSPLAWLRPLSPPPYTLRLPCAGRGGLSWRPAVGAWRSSTGGSAAVVLARWQPHCPPPMAMRGLGHEVSTPRSAWARVGRARGARRSPRRDAANGPQLPHTFFPRHPSPITRREHTVMLLIFHPGSKFTLSPPWEKKPSTEGGRGKVAGRGGGRVRLRCTDT